MKALLAIDGSTESAFGLETAASFAWPTGAELSILTVIPSKAEWYGVRGPPASPTSPRNTSATICGPSVRRFS